jgi:hypothetical protein
MTREEMAQVCISAAGESIFHAELEAIAAELRKSCAGCRHWERSDDGVRCRSPHGVVILMPADGSGYCRPGWEAK